MQRIKSCAHGQRPILQELRRQILDLRIDRECRDRSKLFQPSGGSGDIPRRGLIKDEL